MAPTCRQNPVERNSCGVCMGAADRVIHEMDEIWLASQNEVSQVGEFFQMRAWGIKEC